MSEERTRELITTLGEDLRPVRPIPRLRTALLAVLALWAAIVAAGWVWAGLRPDDVLALYSKRGLTAVFASLALLGAGGVVAALAASVPGRERLAWGGLGVGLLGAAVAAGLGTLLVLAAPGHEAGAPLFGHLRCLGRACLAGAVPALAAAWFAARAAPYRPLAAMLAAAAGAAALGTVAIQAACPYGDPVHLMLGHVLAPLAGALVMTLPLLVAMRRLARAS